MSTDPNQQIIDEFRTNRGQLGGQFTASRMLLLTTTDHATGQPRTTPLSYLHGGDGRTMVLARTTDNGHRPPWYDDLLVEPSVTIENGVFTVHGNAVVLDGDEHDEVLARATEATPELAAAEHPDGSPTPVVAFVPVDGAPVAESWGEALKHLHDAFRRELEMIRTEVATTGPRLGAQLRINCLTLCTGLHYHHTSEDGQLFPLVNEQHPKLAATTTRLREEHQAIQTVLDQLQALVSTDGADPRTISNEVDRLATELEAHLRYEEEQLIPVLDALTP